MFPASGSRKLTGLIITIASLFALVLVAVVVTVLTNQTALTGLFQTIGGYITGLGTAHQGAQAFADRSANYPNGIGTPTPGMGMVPPAPAMQPTPLFPEQVSAPPPPSAHSRWEAVPAALMLVGGLSLTAVMSVRLMLA